MAKLIKPTGEIIEVNPKNGVEFTAKELGEMIGGYIDGLTVDDSSNIYFDEEFLYKSLPYNYEATKIIRTNPRYPHITICGVALVATRKETGDD